MAKLDSVKVGAKIDSLQGRERAEYEAGVDLNKSLKHLLADAHEELLYNHLYEEEIRKGTRAARSDDQNRTHAQKRLASLQVRIALLARRWQIGAIVVSTLALCVSLYRLSYESTKPPEQVSTLSRSTVENTSLNKRPALPATQPSHDTVVERDSTQRMKESQDSLRRDSKR